MALAEMGRVDVLVNNAIYQGPGTMDRILDLPLELAERCLVGDYLHPLLLTQLVLPGMLERGEGRLVNMLSEAAFTTPPAPAGAGGWGVAYAAAKAAFHRVTDMCHVEFGGRGIAAFSIAPGLTLTESMRASGMDEVLVGAGHVPAPPEVAGEVAAWLGDEPEALQYAGQMVSSRKLCKELGLVPGWPSAAPVLARRAARQAHGVGEGHQVRGRHVGGARTERAEQLLERLVAERRRRRARPARRSAPRPGRAACGRRRWHARRHGAGPRGERGRGGVPLVLAPAPVVPQDLDRDALGPGRQHVRLHAARCRAPRARRRARPRGARAASCRPARPRPAPPCPRPWRYGATRSGWPPP